jgi:hypothetical protein
MTGTDMCVNKAPTTSLFLKGYQDASRTLEKNVSTPEGSTLKTDIQVSVWQLWF